MKNHLLLIHLLFFSALVSCSSSFNNDSKQPDFASKCEHEVDISLSPKKMNQKPASSANANQSRFILRVKTNHALEVKQLLNKSGVRQIEELGDENTLLVVASIDQLKSSIDSCGLLNVHSDVPNFTQ